MVNHTHALLINGQINSFISGSVEPGATLSVTNFRFQADNVKLNFGFFGFITGWVGDNSYI